MTTDEFDRTISDLLDRQPFQTFIVELNDGDQVEIERPNQVATRSGSALYFTPRKYVRFECANVKRIVDAPESVRASQGG